MLETHNMEKTSTMITSKFKQRNEIKGIASKTNQWKVTNIN